MPTIHRSNGHGAAQQEILLSLISAYVSVGLPPVQGLRAKGFQFHAYFYMLFILDSVRSNGFELRRGNASKAKWNGFP